MNYFAHGCDFVHDPYFLAGTAVPDWLSVTDRKVRVRSHQAQTHLDHEDPRVAALAAGIMQHHADDAWFHDSAVFNELSWKLTVDFRNALPPDAGFRPSFLGHILVELLLDAELLARRGGCGEDYYQAVESIDAKLVQSAVNSMASRPALLLPVMIGGFCRERFLFDYADDGKLCFRLNQVLRRVNLPLLPESFCEALAAARVCVAQRWTELAPDRARGCQAYVHGVSMPIGESGKPNSHN
jgi:hypothetical protein